MIRRIVFVLIVISGIFNFSAAQKFQIEKHTLVYKEVDGVQLEMVVYQPKPEINVQVPAIVFYFGGGWVSGNPDHFALQAEYLASRGMVAVCPDYRTKSKHGTTPFESVKDAISAMRYLKTHGAEMGIDTSRIVAAGGSAGGHLAACTALIDDVEEETDNTKISPKPFALVLFNPVVDTGKNGYGQEKLDGREFEISPVHHITPNAPPTLIMHGKADDVVSYENVVRFRDVMKQEGNECILKGYKKQGHGFFNYNQKPCFFRKTLQRTEVFLDEYNLLRGESWVKKYVKSVED
ncbi:MAG: alpha/beta hydrolase [Tangfeifania sp.]